MLTETQRRTLKAINAHEQPMIKVPYYGWSIYDCADVDTRILLYHIKQRTLDALLSADLVELDGDSDGNEWVKITTDGRLIAEGDSIRWDDWNE